MQSIITLTTLTIIIITTIFINPVNSDSARLQCLLSITNTQNLISNPTCNPQLLEWDIPQGQWTFLQNVVGSPQGCCLPTESNDNNNMNMETSTGGVLSLVDAPLSQSVTNLNSYIDIIDTGNSQLKFIISFSTLSLSETNGFVLDISFIDGNGELLGRDTSSGAQVNDVVPRIDERRFLPVNIPVNTRRFDLAVWASGGRSVCFNTFVATIEVPRSQSLFFQSVSKVYFVAIVSTLSLTILVAIYFMIRKLLKGEKFPIPFDLIDQSEYNPLLYSLFVATSVWVFNGSIDVFVNNDRSLDLFGLDTMLEIEGAVAYFKIVFLILEFIAGSTLFWPIFMCYNQRHHFSANIIGIVCLCALFFYRFTALLLSLDKRNLIVLELIIRLPEFIAICTSIILFAGQFYTLLRTTRRNRRLDDSDDIQSLSSSLFAPSERTTKLLEQSYTRNLLYPQIKKQKSSKEVVGQSSTLLLSRKSFSYDIPIVAYVARIYGADANLRIPKRIVVSQVMLVSMILQLSVGFIKFFYDIDNREYVCDAARLGSQDPEEVIAIAKEIWVLGQIAFILSAVLGGATCIWVASGVIESYKFHIAKLRRGVYDFIPKGRGSLGLDVGLTYVGYSVGFGFLSCILVMVETLAIFVIIILLVRVESVRVALWDALGQGIFLIPIAVAFLLRYIQYFVTRYFFQSNNTDANLRIIRRRGFDHWEFYQIFANLVISLTRWIIRMMISIFNITLYSMRLDYKFFLGIWEYFDAGHQAYLGMLLQDHMYNNPVAITFLSLLPYRNGGSLDYYNEGSESKGSSSAKVGGGVYKKLNDDVVVGGEFGFKTEEGVLQGRHTSTRRGIRSVTRWHLAYTLINNPVFRIARKKRIEELKSEGVHGLDEAINYSTTLEREFVATRVKRRKDLHAD